MKEYDIIVIGSGHNSLIIAGCLAKLGLEVALFERRHEFGGGLCSEEVTIPGFLHNLHSTFHVFREDLPVYKFLELDRHVRYIRPRVQQGYAFSDGTCLVVYPDLERTCQEIARFSPKDAETYRQLVPRFRGIAVKELYSAPLPPDQRDALYSGTEAGREYLAFGLKSPRELAEELFMDDKIRAFMIFNMCIYGLTDDYPKTGSYLIRSITSAFHLQIAEGGSHQLAHAFTNAVLLAGGLVFENCPVERIIVQDGQARGIELAATSSYPEKTVWARKAIVSGIDHVQTFLKLVGPDHLDPALVKKINDWKWEEWALFGVHLALKEPPRYKAARFNRDIDEALMWTFGYDHPDQLAEHWREIRAGELPKHPGGNCTSLTRFDPAQAPPGKHTGMFWQFSPFNLKDGGSEKWDQAKKEYLELCVERWRQYAPNLTPRNILSSYAYSPLDITRKNPSMGMGGAHHGRYSYDQLGYFRPCAELSQYRTPIKNLYITGSSTHPGGAITGAPGYNCLNLMAQDLGLTKAWEES